MNLLKSIYHPQRPVLQHIFLSTALAFAICALIMLSVEAITQGGLAPPAYPAPSNPAVFLVTALVLAPVLENTALTLLIEILPGFFDKVSSIVVVVAVLSGIAHFMASPPLLVGGAIMFAVMTASYLLFYARPYYVRLMIITAQHILFNLPAALYAQAGA